MKDKIQELLKNKSTVIKMTNTEICEEYGISLGTWNQIKTKHKIKNKRKKKISGYFFYKPETIPRLKKIQNIDTSVLFLSDLQKLLNFNNRQSVSAFCKKHNVKYLPKRENKQ